MLAWCLLRLGPRGVVLIPNCANITLDQTIPLWYEFYRNLSRGRNSYIVVAYSLIIDAKPVDMATMYSTMRKCKDMSAALGQHHSFQTIDQQLYAFAQQLKWDFPDEYPAVEIWPVTDIPILGPFTSDFTDHSSKCLERARK